MQVLVKKKFKDKHTGIIYGAGTTVKLTKRRFLEVLENLGGDFVEDAEVPESITEETETEETETEEAAAEE